MAEATLDLRGLPKGDAYAHLDGHIRAVLEGVNDDIAAMATMAALIHHAFGFLWTGFYRGSPPMPAISPGAAPATLTPSGFPKSCSSRRR